MRPSMGSNLMPSSNNFLHDISLIINTSPILSIYPRINPTQPHNSTLTPASNKSLTNKKRSFRAVIFQDLHSLPCIIRRSIILFKRNGLVDKPSSRIKIRTNVRAARLFCVQDVKTLAIPEERTRGPATTPLNESTARPKTLRTTAARALRNIVWYERDSGWCRIYHPSISQPLPASKFQQIIINTHSSRAHGTLVEEMEREVTRRLVVEKAQTNLRDLYLTNEFQMRRNSTQGQCR